MIFIYAVLLMIALIIWLPINDDLEALAVEKGTYTDSTDDTCRERIPLLSEEGGGRQANQELELDGEDTHRSQAREEAASSFTSTVGPISHSRP